MTDTVSIILDVTVDLSLYFTEEEYYPQYKDNIQAKLILQEKIKDSVSFSFRIFLFIFVFILTLLPLDSIQKFWI